MDDTQPMVACTTEVEFALAPILTIQPPLYLEPEADYHC